MSEPNDEATPQIRVWVDGELGGPAATVKALDHGVTVGDGVFETCKVVDGEVFAQRRHHDRMDRSLAALGLPPLDRGRVQEGIDAVLSQAGMPFGRLRYTVTGGVGPLGSERHTGGLTYIVTAMAQEPPAATATALLVPWTRNERGALTGVKSTSYAENVVALAAAKTAGCDEAILANTSGLLCEGTGTNVFVVAGGVVRTPSLASGPLAGVTRGLVVQWLGEEGIPVEEADLPVEALADADEIWLTSSLRDITPLTRLAVADPVRLASGTLAPMPEIEPRELGEAPLAQQAREVFARRAAAQIDP